MFWLLVGPHHRTRALPSAFRNLTNLKGNAAWASSSPARRKIDFNAHARSVSAVLRLRQFACLLLVALWLPATSHCDFEAVGLDELFHCETDHHSANADADSVDACNVVENGWIKRASSDVPVSPSLAKVCLGFLVAAWATPAPEAVAPIAIARTVAPPELAPTWQFTTRAALPSRAPSLAS